jgi:hypothetical protein
MTNLLRGHVVQADGFSARTLRAKGGSATVVALLQQTACGQSSNKSLSEIWHRPALPNGEGTMTDSTVDKIVDHRPQLRNTSIQHCLATASNTEPVV